MDITSQPDFKSPTPTKRQSSCDHPATRYYSLYFLWWRFRLVSLLSERDRSWDNFKQARNRFNILATSWRRKLMRSGGIRQDKNLLVIEDKSSWTLDSQQSRKRHEHCKKMPSIWNLSSNENWKAQILFRRCSLIPRSMRILMNSDNLQIRNEVNSSMTTLKAKKKHNGKASCAHKD